MIPEFDERGNLPPGIHHATWNEIVTRYATSVRHERAAQKERYGGELFPAQWPANADGTTYLDYFQRDRFEQPKGIVAIDLTGLP
jgi:hypothetical protein